MISKALITVKQRPQVVNHVDLLHEAGCDTIIVVASPDTEVQVRNVLERSGLDSMGVHVIVQPEPRGPVDAVMTALQTFDDTKLNGSTYLMFSDTFIDEPLPDEGDWVGISLTYAEERSFCFRVGLDNDAFIDGIPLGGAPVFIGAARFQDTRHLYMAATEVLMGNADNEVGMGRFLSKYVPAQIVAFKTWRDVGDIMSLVRARRGNFTARGSHEFTLSGSTSITKWNVSDDELEYVRTLEERPDVARFFPQVYGTSGNSYTMEFIDQPTLAELWLYWPGLPQTWADIVSHVIEEIKYTDMWRPLHPSIDVDAGTWMADKAIVRIQEWMPGFFSTNDDFIEKIRYCGRLIGHDIRVHGHGDLNFTNILFSLNSGIVRFIDPRGTSVPLIYEYAKLAFSHIFSSVVHGLYEWQVEDVPRLLPDREAEMAAVMSVLTRDVDESRLRAAMALILVAAPTFHSREDGHALWCFGLEMLEEVIS